MSVTVQDLQYRPEIDGLRAVAVAAVVLFHAGILLSGGFVGVDVFFVISGYLITSLIARDLERGTFTLAAFWERRARRILPAVVVVTLTTLVAGGVLLLPFDYLRLGKSALGQACFVANIYFYRNTGYFAPGTDQLPLLQTWSPAVEEQFYVVAPLLLMGLFRFGDFRRRRFFALLFAIAAFASFMASVFMVATHPQKAFYLLPGRAWEMLLGSLIALDPAAHFPKKQVIREAASLAGIVGILLPCFFYSNRTPFPGVAALPPCLGTALIIWGNSPRHQGESGATVIGRILTARPVVFLGVISYSLYLWHWPVLAFSRYWALDPLSTGSRLAIVACSLILGVVSWKFIENPFRRKQLCKTRKSIAIFAGASICINCFIAAAIIFSGGVPQRLPKEASAFADGQNGTPLVENVTPEMIKAGSIPQFGPQRKDGGVNVLLWGDSHAQHFMPALKAACEEEKLAGQIISFTSTTPLVGWAQHSQHGLNEKSESWCEAVVEYVNRMKIQNVIVAARWEDAEQQTVEFTKALERTITALRASGARVYVIMQVPSHPAPVPKILVYSYLAHKPSDAWQSTWEQHAEKHKTMYWIKNNSKSFGPALVDPASCFRESDSGLLKIEDNGRPLYTDTQHLTAYGSKIVMTPVFRSLLDGSHSNGGVNL